MNHPEIVELEESGCLQTNLSDHPGIPRPLFGVYTPPPKFNSLQNQKKDRLVPLNSHFSTDFSPVFNFQELSLSISTSPISKKETTIPTFSTTTFRETPRNLQGRWQHQICGILTGRMFVNFQHLWPLNFSGKSLACPIALIEGVPYRGL